MKSINEIFNSIDKKVYKYNYRNNEQIIYTDDGKYTIQEKKGNTKEIFNYLHSRNFDNYIPLENNYNDIYEIYKFQEDSINLPDKSIDLIYLLSILHTKTTTYREINLDRVKEIYEEFNKQLKYLDTYYNNMQDYIESQIYMSPAEYLLIKNISKIYKFINYSKNNIDKWYDIKTKSVKERVTLIHNNLSIDNFVDTASPAFKNWDKATKDLVVYDFYKFYKNNYKDLEFSSLFELYQSKYKYTKDEMLLFNALILKPWKVEFKSNNYNNCILVNDLITYIDKTQLFLLEENQKEQKANKNKFNQENNNV